MDLLTELAFSVICNLWRRLRIAEEDNARLHEELNLLKTANAPMREDIVLLRTCAHSDQQMMDTSEPPN